MFAPTWHCVDDFTGIEDARSAGSAFIGFRELNRTVGLKIKEKKEQKPKACHRIQGVYLRLAEDGAFIEPLEDRRKKIVDELKRILASGWCNPQKAGKLAGKCAFRTRSLMGRVESGGQGTVCETVCRK